MHWWGHWPHFLSQYFQLNIPSWQVIESHQPASWGNNMNREQHIPILLVHKLKPGHQSQFLRWFVIRIYIIRLIHFLRLLITLHVCFLIVSWTRKSRHNRQTSGIAHAHLFTIYILEIVQPAMCVVIWPCRQPRIRSAWRGPWGKSIASDVWNEWYTMSKPRHLAELFADDEERLQ